MYDPETSSSFKLGQDRWPADAGGLSRISHSFADCLQLTSLFGSIEKIFPRHDMLFTSFLLPSILFAAEIPLAPYNVKVQHKIKSFLWIGFLSSRTPFYQKFTSGPAMSLFCHSLRIPWIFVPKQSRSWFCQFHISILCKFVFRRVFSTVLRVGCWRVTRIRRRTKKAQM